MQKNPFSLYNSKLRVQWKKKEQLVLDPKS